VGPSSGSESRVHREYITAFRVTASSFALTLLFLHTLALIFTELSFALIQLCAQIGLIFRGIEKSKQTSWRSDGE
jgi:hypothetical protein